MLQTVERNVTVRVSVQDHHIITVQRQGEQALLPLQQPLPTIATDPSRKKRRMESRKTREEING